eukprot:scaffold8526_cov100-Isochrysis_galbana.AAC.5
MPCSSCSTASSCSNPSSVVGLGISAGSTKLSSPMPNIGEPGGADPSAAPYSILTSSQTWAASSVDEKDRAHSAESIGSTRSTVPADSVNRTALSGRSADASTVSAGPTTMSRCLPSSACCHITRPTPQEPQPAPSLTSTSAPTNAAAMLRRP